MKLTMVGTLLCASELETISQIESLPGINGMDSVNSFLQIPCAIPFVWTLKTHLTCLFPVVWEHCDHGLVG